MLGGAIGSQALGHAGPRTLASEFGGPRPAAVPGDFSKAAEAGARLMPVEADPRTERASRP